MERGVYVSQLGDLTEITAIDRRGDFVRRVTVRTADQTEADIDELRRYLDRRDRVIPAAGALRLV